MCLIDPNNIHNPSQKEEMSGGFQIANMEALRAALMEVDKDVTHDTPFHMLIKSAVKAINEYAVGFFLNEFYSML
ncbi:hypothetical protein WR25_22335 [Diploscapter pachys]|uniref:Uncharacterized protein n=1 Tax=Diploscapter pachys TaxID=2018661 RepID=A0A2A2L5X6_9BILA|nr:hypothetical protein WR25_22335 [Diploscapter pachys]